MRPVRGVAGGARARGTARRSRRATRRPRATYDRWRRCRARVRCGSTRTPAGRHGPGWVHRPSRVRRRVTSVPSAETVASTGRRVRDWASAGLAVGAEPPTARRTSRARRVVPTMTRPSREVAATQGRPWWSRLNAGATTGVKAPAATDHPRGSAGGGQEQGPAVVDARGPRTAESVGHRHDGPVRADERGGGDVGEVQVAEVADRDRAGAVATGGAVVVLLDRHGAGTDVAHPRDVADAARIGLGDGADGGHRVDPVAQPACDVVPVGGVAPVLAAEVVVEARHAVALVQAPGDEARAVAEHEAPGVTDRAVDRPHVAGARRSRAARVVEVAGDRVEDRRRGRRGRRGLDGRCRRLPGLGCGHGSGHGSGLRLLDRRLRHDRALALPRPRVVVGRVRCRDAHTQHPTRQAGRHDSAREPSAPSSPHLLDGRHCVRRA